MTPRGLANEKVKIRIARGKNACLEKTLAKARSAKG
jgi:hypothetical protein